MSEENKPEEKPQSQDEVQYLKERVAALEKEKAEWSSKNAQAPVSLNEKVRIEREDQERKANDSRELEKALTFNLTAENFLKQNESILSGNFKQILDASSKENYDSAVNKSNALKSAWIQEYFSQQSNVDQLTESQKQTLADFNKLTKNGKEERASLIWNNLLEPSLEMTKRISKAEQVAKAKLGFGGNTNSDQAYKNKLSDMAARKFFGGKSK